jgi:MoaA/NifB/PqqE/SkfB family radical SAM enzyme
MKLTGLHLLLTYECTYECDHCFVWSGPWHTGTMTLGKIDDILSQAKALGTVEWIYFEGGEPFLYHAILRRGVRTAAEMGFRVGIVSNGYWATERRDAAEWLKDLAGLVQDLSISGDDYHGGKDQLRHAANACEAARSTGIPVSTIAIAQPDSSCAASPGQLPEGESAVMYRGRAAAKLADRAESRPWAEFTECPCENLREPGRVHVDPFGNLHICQGISLGNLFRTPLAEICASYEPDAHPITGPLLRGGPAELVRCYGLPHAEGYADACHLCDRARHALRPRFPEILTPDQMYGAGEEQASADAPASSSRVL